MDDLDPALLRVLRAVADTGSISGAATRLGSSQPAVSQLVRRAEQRLGHALVLRGARGATLTEAGAALAVHAVHVDAALTAAAEDLAAIGGLARGRVRLVGFPSASSTIVPALLARLAVDAPGLTTTYVEVEPPEALDLLRQGEADVALTFTYVGDAEGVADDPSLSVRPVGVDPLALVTAAGAGTPTGAGALAGVAESRAGRRSSGSGARGTSRGASLAAPGTPSGTSAAARQAVGSDRTGGPAPVPQDPAPFDTAAPVDLAELRDARWIGGCPRCRGHLLASCAASGFVPEVVFETDNAAAVVGLVAAGLGVALLPRLALDTTVIPERVVLHAVADDLGRRVEVVVPRGADRVPSVGAVLDAVRAVAPPLLASSVRPEGRRER